MFGKGKRLHSRAIRCRLQRQSCAQYLGVFALRLALFYPTFSRFFQISLSQNSDLPDVICSNGTAARFSNERTAKPLSSRIARRKQRRRKRQWDNVPSNICGKDPSGRRILSWEPISVCPLEAEIWPRQRLLPYAPRGRKNPLAHVPAEGS